MPIKGQKAVNNSPEAGPKANLPDENSQPAEGAVPGREKPETAPSEKTRAETRAGLDNIQQTIEEEKKEKQARRDFLKDECAKRRNPERWTTRIWEGKQPEEGIGSSIVKGIISTGVEQKFADYMDQFRENGLGDPTNVDAIKTVAKEIIYAHYTETGSSESATKEYIKTGLGEKLKYLLNGLKEINSDTRYGFKKPIDCLQAFSDFTGLDFISNGYARLENLKKALLLERSDYEFFLKSFKQYLNINLELTDLSGRETNAAAKKPEKMDVGAMLKEGKISLKSPVRITFSSNTDESLAQARKDIYDRLPDNTDPKARDIIVTYITDELKKGNTGPGETVEISVNGSFRTVDLSAEQAAQAMTQKQAEEEVKKASSENTEGFKDGIGKFIAALLALLQNLMGSFNGMAAKVGLGVEFAGLDAAETKDATEFKKTAEKSGLILETLAPLLKNAEQMKKILKERKEKKLNWEDYFSKYLSTAENDELKKKQDIDAEKIAAMFLSTNETPTA
jgi:hypothetical protein